MTASPLHSESSHSRPAWTNWLQIHLVVLAWGFTGPLGKLISLPPMESVAWRTGLAAVGLALLARVMKAALAMSAKEGIALIGTGMLVGIHWMLFFLSVKLGNVSVTMAALPTTMLWCTLLEPCFDRKRRITALELGMGALMVAAVAMIFRVEFAQWRGFTAGLACAMVGALFAVINKHLVARGHYAVISCYQMIGACGVALLTLAVVASQGTSVQSPQGSDWVWLLILSLVCTVGAYAAYMDVLRRMSVFSINVVYNLEPVYGIVLGALLFGDTSQLSPGFYAGAGLILAAVIATPWLQRRIANRQGDRAKADTANDRQH